MNDYYDGLISSLSDLNARAWTQHHAARAKHNNYEQSYMEINPGLANTYNRLAGEWKALAADVYDFQMELTRRKRGTQ
jgi:hypothetical protein